MLAQQLPINQQVGLLPPLPPFRSPCQMTGLPAVSGAAVIAILALVLAQLPVLTEVAMVDYSATQELEQVFPQLPLPNLH